MIVKGNVNQGEGTTADNHHNIMEGRMINWLSVFLMQGPPLAVALYAVWLGCITHASVYNTY